MIFLKKVQQAAQRGQLSPDLETILTHFFYSYMEAAQENGYEPSAVAPILETYLDKVFKQLSRPYKFELFHQRMTKPFDYYQLGLDLLRPLVVFSESKVIGLKNATLIETQLKKKENAILFANHQTEPDPQAISLLLEKTHPQLAEEMIFVAGHRVISDPLAVPLSRGRNLLCIYSKNYIENPPELKPEKLLHNQRTMKRMAQLLSEGGKCIYVAPSGGRDRPNSSGKVHVARFDPQSIEMFWLMSQQSDRVTHFYPLSLATYKLLPPPNSVQKTLGERRQAHCTPIHLAFGDEIDMEHDPGYETVDKKLKRKIRADYIWGLVNAGYSSLINHKK
jgi:glycerol-3-phosphate O-acyltransferase